LNQSPRTDVEIDRTTDWPEILSFVRDYWHGKRGARTMPCRSDISPSQLKSQLPHVLLADTIDGGVNFRYRLVGTKLRPFFHSEPSGKLMSEALAPFGEATVHATLDIYRGVIERGVPMRITGSGSLFGQDPKFFDAWLAPLSDDGVTTNMILGTFIFVWDFEHQFRPPIDPRLAGHAIISRGQSPSG
jgi:hypothetical protein